MKITEEIWTQLAALLKAKLLAKYNPGNLASDGNDIKPKLEVQHSGFYITVYDSNKDKMVRAGFLQEDCKNVLDSANKVVEAIYNELEAKNIPHKKLPTSSYNFAIVWDLVFIENALAWDENADGVYLSWGDKYKGMYLPHDIQQMPVTKTEVLNRLCSYIAQIPSNLWRLPECLNYKIIADSYTLS